MKNSCSASIDSDSDIDHRFACNICFEQVSEPVVTRCGHLYCWPCLFQWLEPGMNPQERIYLSQSYSWRIQDVNPSRRICPVCKAECSVMTVIPIYVREDENSNEDKEVNSEDHQLTNHVDDAINEESSVAEECTESLTSVRDSEQETTGIRQRRNRIEQSRASVRQDVPSRPQPQRMNSSHRVSQHYVHGRQSTSVITQISSLLHNLQMEQQNNASHLSSSTVDNNVEQRVPAIPSLHNRRLEDTDFSSNLISRGNESVESAMTELVGRVLLVMGSLVILFLLVF
mmetsp:Transcript_13009/g.24437  ORF Transcript_13009/g.24437 Transcript_13009/m.24437 type:complete len:286 (+) Transcript_13009:201-1058(+)